MSWRLPPPIWIASRQQTLLGVVLQLGAVSWRLAKWCVAAGLALALLSRFTTAAHPLRGAAAWIAGGALLVFLWERYGIGDAALRGGRWPRALATTVLLVAAGAGTWAVAHGAASIARAALGWGARVALRR